MDPKATSWAPPWGASNPSPSPSLSPKAQPGGCPAALLVAWLCLAAIRSKRTRSPASASPEQIPALPPTWAGAGTRSFLLSLSAHGKALSMGRARRSSHSARALNSPDTQPPLSPRLPDWEVMCKDRGAVSVLQPWDRARKKGPTGIQMGGQRLRFQGRAGKQERVWARGMKKVGEVLGEKGYQQGHGLPLLTPAWQRAFKITRSAFQKPAIPGEKIHASLLRAGCTPRCKPGVPGSRTTPANTPRAPGPRPPAKPPADWAPGCAAAGTIEGMAELGPLWEGGHIAKGATGALSPSPNPGQPRRAPPTHRSPLPWS